MNMRARWLTIWMLWDLPLSIPMPYAVVWCRFFPAPQFARFVAWWHRWHEKSPESGRSEP